MRGGWRKYAFDAGPYLLGALAIAACTVAKHAVHPLGQGEPFALYFLVVLPAALYGGPRLGLFTLALAAVACALLFLAPAGSWSLDPSSILKLTAFLGEGAAITFVSSAVQRGRHDATRLASREAHARGAAEEARHRFQGVFDHSLDPMILLDDDLAVVDANRAATNFFGETREEIVGCSATARVAPADRAAWLEQWDRRQSDAPLRSEASFVKRDGTHRLFEVSASPNIRPHLHLAILRDVEDHRRTELLVRFLNEASEILAGSLDTESALADVARRAVPRVADWAAVHMVQPGGALRCSALAHADAQKLADARPLLDACPLRTDDASGVGRVVRTGAPELCERPSSERFGRSFDDPRTLAAFRELGLVSSVCVPLRVQGRAVGALSLGSAESGRHFRTEDLTFAQELAHRASVALENARNFRESQEANRVKDEFLATISHELRTPLNAILGWTTMLRRKPDVDAKKALDTIERNARAQMRLVEDVLDVSRAVTGKLKIEPNEIDLGDVLRAAIEVVTPMAEARGVSAVVSIDPSPCPFYGDADRLQQAFWNVLSNAIKFTGKGGRVNIRLTRTASLVELVVADTGRGIHPEFLPYVFDRFRQADSSTTRAEGGLGLGLAIVRHIVELHGGSVRAESAGEGRGTTFTLTLPVRAVQAQAPAPSRVPRASSGVYLSNRTGADVARDLSGIRVLVCDDDEDARELLGAVLSAEGAAVCTASSGVRAIEALREFGPHVFISDVGMPQLDGYELIRQVRGLPEDQGGQTPAIALTAYARREDELKAYLAGYQVHLAKPVEPTRLVHMVANLAGRPMQRDKERPGN